jgi:acyl dehydratase
MAIEAWNGTYEDLPLGAEESASQLIDGSAIDAFAHAIQSYNPVHMDGDWARDNTHYPDRIAHGVMTTALMSQPLVQFCERYKIRTALLTSSSRYTRAVIAGDTVTTTVRLAEKIDKKMRIRFEVQTKNQKNEVVMIGELLEQCI